MTRTEVYEEMVRKRQEQHRKMLEESVIRPLLDKMVEEVTIPKTETLPTITRPES